MAGPFQHDEARFAIIYAHTMTEIVSLLVSDLQQAGVLRPNTKGKIQEILARQYDPKRAEAALRQLQERMKVDSFQEREQKKETPKKPD